MKNAYVTGLGEPETTGKRSLFRPPANNVATIIQTSPEAKIRRGALKKIPPARVHLTTDLTVEALNIIQNIQHEYRIKHGKVLPQWKVLSRAIEYYGKVRLKAKAA